MTGIEFVLAALGVIVLCSLAVAVAFVLVLVTVVRRIRRSRAVADTSLRVRAQLSRGPRRSVLALRRRLGESLRSGQAAIDLAAGGTGPRGELPRLFRRIREEGGVLDLQLRLLESEADAAVLGSELPIARRRVEQVEGLVRRLRDAVGSGLAGITDDTLSDLDGELEREVEALAEGIRTLRRVDGAPQAAPHRAAPHATARPRADGAPQTTAPQTTAPQTTARHRGNRS